MNSKLKIFLLGQRHFSKWAKGKPCVTLECGGSTPLSFFADHGKTKERKKAVSSHRSPKLPTPPIGLRAVVILPILKSGAVQLMIYVFSSLRLRAFA